MLFESPAVLAIRAGNNPEFGGAVLGSSQKQQQSTTRDRFYANSRQRVSRSHG